MTNLKQIDSAQYQPLAGKKVILGVTGSIAAYKAVELASTLTRQGATVKVALTADSQRFITPTTFEAITGEPTLSDVFGPYKSSDSEKIAWGHTKLAGWGDILVIAPATCDTIAKLANGFADNAVTCTSLAFGGLRMLAPAMETTMYESRAVQKNMEILRDDSWHIAGPATGRLASGQIGLGRMVEPYNLSERIRWLLGKKGELAGLKVVITAGGTREPLDSVRYLSNASSGKMGYALATVARDRGAETVLISTIDSLPVLDMVKFMSVKTAQSMEDAVKAEVSDANLLLMAAAVADFKIKNPFGGKISKTDGVKAYLNLKFEINSDIVAQASGEKLVKVAFIAVSGGSAKEQEKIATDKAVSKGAAFVVLNDISDGVSGFGSDTSRAKFVNQDGKIKALKLMDKIELSNKIMDEAKPLLT